GYSWQTYNGYNYIWYPALFIHQYSHCWVDFRNLQDVYTKGKGLDYAENSRRATLAQWEYCKQNLGGWTGYSANVWGLTACDGPNTGQFKGYIERGGPPARNDDGTIAPTAAGGSMPFTPEISLPTLKYLYDTYRTSLWTPYGFRDAFNLTANWWAPDEIGIDQGPLIIMAENYRTQSVWKIFMKSAIIQQGLSRAGFLSTTNVSETSSRPLDFELKQNFPNPFNPTTNIVFQFPERTYVSLKVFDMLGREVTTLVDEIMEPGVHTKLFDTRSVVAVSSGVYFYRIQAGRFAEAKPMMLVK
ncbi:MAG: glucoamylase family protein, partial [Bacteroidota bacterium]